MRGTEIDEQRDLGLCIQLSTAQAGAVRVVEHLGAAVMLTERDSRSGPAGGEDAGYWRGAGRGGLVVGAGLEGEQFGVEPAGGHELAVGAAFGELPVVEDGDEVGHAHGGEAVGDEHGDAAVFPSGLRG